MAQMRSVVTLSNSIIGVSILAMPFCFKQCGIVLAILMLYLSGLLVKATSYFLLKSAIMARRRNYETLAFNVFGAAGKLAIEVSMIGFLGGTCIAFFVVMGDLAPPIIAGYLGIENSERLRIGVMLGVGLVVVLPLSLLRNIDSLVALCTASILFYALVMLYIIFTSLESLVGGEWWSQAIKWRPAGIFQCLPIFTMALSCQAQLFEVYDTLPDPSLGQMVEIVKGAVNLCSGIYICVGFFGYIAFYSVDFGGNILTAFPDSFGVEITKMGFALSVAVSFPMVIFPCRTSINSILFARKGGGSSTDLAKNYIPHERFVFITTCVVLSTLFTAIQIPDIELVLGIVGSTIGTVICILFPVSMFIKLVNANTTERLVAQAIFVIGVIVLVLGTYVTLYEADSKHTDNQVMNRDPAFVAPHPIAIKSDVIDPQVVMPPVPDVNVKLSSEKTTSTREKEKDVKKELEPNLEVRQEPIQPLPPNDDVIKKEDVVPHVSTEETKSSASIANAEKLAEKNIKEKEKVLEIKEKQANKLIKELKVQKKEHEQIIKEQKEVLEQLKEHVDAEKALESNAAQILNKDSSNQMSNNQQEMHIKPQSLGNRPQQQVPIQNPPAQIPVASNQLPNNKQQLFQQNVPQLQVFDNPSPVVNQNVQIQPDHLKQASGGSQQQTNNFYQQARAQSQPDIQQQNHPHQVAQNQVNNIQEIQNLNLPSNQAVQKGVMQNMANHNIEPQAQNQYNTFQYQNVKNETIFVAQPSPNPIVGNQNLQVQLANNAQAPQLQIQQQKVEIAKDQFLSPLKQHQILTNHTMDTRGNEAMAHNALNNINIAGKQANQQMQQQNFKKGSQNDQVIPEMYKDPNLNFNSNPSNQNSGVIKNNKPNNVLNSNDSPQYNMKSTVDNRGKVDVKREINKISKTNSDSEKFKVPGRDLKEAKNDINNYDYNFNARNVKKVKRNVISDNIDSMSDSLNFLNEIPQEHLNTIAVAGIGLEMVKTRNLLSNDHEN